LGMKASRRNEITPGPPSPAFTISFARSTNMMSFFSELQVKIKAQLSVSIKKTVTRTVFKLAFPMKKASTNGQAY
jgi:hypothetical protein